MQNNHTSQAWVTFCMSTYKRPELLKKALKTISRQTFSNFEVVISDNDPDGGAGSVVAGLNDKRFRYFNNGANLGMIRSYNKSIERANTPYVVMITDDDPVTENFLEEMYQLSGKYKGLSIYCGFRRTNTADAEIEIISRENFLSEVLDFSKTPAILWSSCIMNRQAILDVGMMLEGESPALTDHALIAMVGSQEGGLIINKMYSIITIHDNNFSKSNVHYYTIGCREFYENMTEFCKKNHSLFIREKKVIEAHLGYWFIVSIFNLKKFYFLKKNKEMQVQVDQCANDILAYPFMRRFAFRFYIKGIIFQIKKAFNLLRM